MTVSMSFPEWHGKITKKHYLIFKTLAICGYIWVNLIIYQVVLTLI